MPIVAVLFSAASAAASVTTLLIALKAKNEAQKSIEIVTKEVEEYKIKFDKARSIILS